jgi:hypothetical protein
VIRTGYFDLPVIMFIDLLKITGNKTGLHIVPAMALNCQNTHNVGGGSSHISRSMGRNPPGKRLAGEMDH